MSSVCSDEIISGRISDSKSSLVYLQPLHQVCHRQLTETIVHQYGESLHAFIRGKVNNAEDAEDLLQEVFIKISNSQKLSRVENLGSYIFAIAANSVCNKYRNVASRSASQSISIESVELIDDTHNPEDMLEAAQKIGAVWKRVNTLPPRCKQAFLMRLVEGNSYKVIAREMNISTSAVEKFISKGLKIVGDLRSFTAHKL